MDLFRHSFHRAGPAAILAVLSLGAQAGGLSADSPLAVATRASVERAWDALAAGGDIGTAGEAMNAALDAAIAYADPADPEPIREAAQAVRLLGLFEQSSPEGLPGRIGLLRSNPEFAADVAFLLKPQDQADGVFSLLERLNESRPGALRQFPGLCAAVLVVFDEPMPLRRGRPRPVPEGQAAPDLAVVDPLVVLDHFTDNGRKMVFDPAKLPPELAVFVVGVELSPEDLAWAFEKYRGDAQTGRHYDDVPYDTQFFERGLEMKIDRVDYTLPNLLRYGGICGDQAFFAESIAKACGVPAVTVSGTRGEIGHAWAGYLQRQGQKARWNFDEGRYDEFDDVRASADDPQTRREVTTADLALLAEGAKIPRGERQKALALADAAARLAALAQFGDAAGFPPAPPAGVGPGAGGARAATIGSSLELSRAAVDLCPALREAWEGVMALASEGRLDAGQRKLWAEAADQFCGQDYPDFAAGVLGAVIAGIPDTGEQSGLWDWAAKRFARRPDLAAEMLLAKARMWEGAGQKGRAYDEYLRLIEQFGNRTPLAPGAVRAAENLLQGGRESEVVPLYASAWKKIKKPSSASPQFVAASNWYQIGAMYARRLEAAGQKPQAEQVRRQLDSARLHQ